MGCSTEVVGVYVHEHSYEFDGPTVLEHTVEYVVSGSCYLSMPQKRWVTAQ